MKRGNGLRLLKHIDMLLALSDCGSISHAAQALGMTQSAVTKALQRAETDLGQPLFVRTSKGVAPTSAGQICLEHARLIRSYSSEAMNRIDGIQNLPGVLNVGAGASFLDTILPAAIAAVVNAYPSISIRLKNESVANLVEQVRESKLDIAFTSEPPDIGSVRDLHWTPLVGDEMDIAGRKDHPLAQEEKVEMEDLKRFGWVLGNEVDPQRKYFESTFRARGMTLPKVTVEALSRTVAVQIVRSSDLLTVVPSFAMNTTFQDLARINCTDLRWVRVAGFVTRRSFTLPNGARLLIKHVKKMCRVDDTLPARGFYVADIT